jgi:hypothetical protein
MQIGAPGARQSGPFSGSSGNIAWKQCKRPAAMFYSRRYGLRLSGALLRSDDQSKADMTR